MCLALLWLKFVSDLFQTCKQIFGIPKAPVHLSMLYADVKGGIFTSIPYKLQLYYLN